MLCKGFVFALILHVAFAAPQFIGFKDGKIGVNFGGYHAEAGLGGLLSGNAAHGGLSASAGTPFGQEAAAGLGGAVGGRAAGGAFAGATAGGNIGASAGLAGRSGAEASGGLGAEAHLGGASQSVVGKSGSGFQITKQVAVPGQIEYSQSASVSVGAQDESSVVQKIKPPKKYFQEAAQTNTVVVEKQIEIPTIPVAVESGTSTNVNIAQPVFVPQVVPVKSSSGRAASVSASASAAVSSQVPQTNVLNFQKSLDFSVGGGYAPVAPIVSPPQTVVYRKHHIPRRHRVHVHKQITPIFYQPEPVAVVEKRKFFVPAPPPPPEPRFPLIEAGTAKSGSFAAAASGSVGGGSLFDSIFNIPIATLKAVNGLLNTSLQGSGSFAFGKAVSG